jgi:His/Glu/Gln/Arg/opine family amino acid ABC transporter permease subunit
MNFLIENWGFVLKGLWMTVRLALVILLFTTLISTVFGVLATLKSRVLCWAIHGYVELFRSIPLIVNVFFIFFGAPMLGLDLSPFAAVVTGLTLWGSANGIEIVRGGLESGTSALADLPVRHCSAVNESHFACLHGPADHAGPGHFAGGSGWRRRVSQGRSDHR